VFHVFFVSFVTIILTTGTGLRAVDPLSGYMTNLDGSKIAFADKMILLDENSLHFRQKY